jgi:hypothetical protein
VYFSGSLCFKDQIKIKKIIKKTGKTNREAKNNITNKIANLCPLTFEYSKMSLNALILRIVNISLMRASKKKQSKFANVWQMKKI